jgi:Xaa-Pro aminopeptidase
MIQFFINSPHKKDPVIEYLTSYSPTFCVLAIKDKKKCLFVTPFETEDYSKIKCFPFSHDTFKKNLKKYFGNIGPKIGVNKSCITLNELKFLKRYVKSNIIDVSGELASLRKIKSRDEIKKIADSCNATDQIFLDIVKKAHSFRCEKDIYSFIKHRAIDLGYELAFDPVVATYKNASKPHHRPDNTPLKGFTVLDFGMKKVYCSDMTRTLYFGIPSKAEINEYNSLLAIQKQFIIDLKSNLPFKELAKRAVDLFGKKMNHSLGHGLGVEVHEEPGISLRSKDSIREGMVFTIEPGVYLKSKFGIRIEDTIAFIDGKPIILTNSTKEFISIKR